MGISHLSWFESGKFVPKRTRECAFDHAAFRIPSGMQFLLEWNLERPGSSGKFYALRAIAVTMSSSCLPAAAEACNTSE